MEIINVIVFLLLLRKSVCEYEECNDENILIAKIPNKTLKHESSHIIHTIKVEKVERCLGICRIMRCHSMNVKKDYQNIITCTLLNVDRLSPPHVLIDSGDTTYYERRLKPHCSSGSWFGPHVDGATDCVDVYNNHFRQTGWYGITVAEKKIYVICIMDMGDLDGGYTLFQRRNGGGVHFNRSWEEYRSGFGRMVPDSDFWLGNDVIHQMTKDRLNSFIVVLNIDSEGETMAKYNNFNVGNKEDRYKLTLTGYVPGSNSENRLANINQAGFSTYDVGESTSCAALHQAGFWIQSNNCNPSEILNQDSDTTTSMLMFKRNDPKDVLKIISPFATDTDSSLL